MGPIANIMPLPSPERPWKGIPEDEPEESDGTNHHNESSNERINLISMQNQVIKWKAMEASDHGLMLHYQKVSGLN